MTNAKNRFDWLAEMFIEEYGVDGAVAQLQTVYDEEFGDRANQALEVLSEIRQQYDVANEGAEV
ncbi:MAG: hypothetical protein R6V05_04100 [Candidatus Brocadiia bacterium]